MTNRTDETGALFLRQTKESGLTQEQLGEKVSMDKSEISEIEHKPVNSVTPDIIHYLVMCMGIFARQYKLTRKEACNYLSRFKGLQFSIDNYEAEHQLSLQDCVDDMYAICKRNGGELK